MHKKTLSLATIFIFLSTLLGGFLTLSANMDTHKSPASSVDEMRGGVPLRLKIPKINLDAAVYNVALTPDGAMDLPKGPLDVGWYELGPRPGEKGSAVLAGHRTWLNGKPGIFINLYKLQKGDTIIVEDNKGVTQTFTVRESRTYDPKAKVPEVFLPNNGTHLNLITCDGVWDKGQKMFTKRLVIFADKAM